jgi:hypothetical protein
MAWLQPQSHFWQLRHSSAPSGDGEPAEFSDGLTARYARRALLRAAVFDADGREPGRYQPAASVATGVIAAVREDCVVLDGRHGAELFAVSEATVTWRGTRTSPAALHRGDPVVIRHAADPASPGRRLAARIWARMGRVAGPIVAAEGRELLVDTDRGPRRVVLAEAAVRPVQVRFPRLRPGYLLDVIGTRHDDHLLAVAPATAQPPYRAGQAPAPAAVRGPLPVPASGSAVWHEPGDEPPDLLGVGYPGLEPESGGQPAGGPGCVRLPYLALGSAVRVGNECTGRSAVLPVTSDSVVSRQFCDRCTDCTTSPRGRVADLTMAAFVELGGHLEDGCFSATIAAAG